MNVQDIGRYMSEYPEVITIVAVVFGLVIVKYGISGLSSIVQNTKEK